MSKRILIGLAVVLGLGLSSSAQAAPSAYTGTLQITVEGLSSGLAALGGTADVSLATGSIALPRQGGPWVMTWTVAAVTSHPLFTSIGGNVELVPGGTFTPSGGPGGAFGGDLPIGLFRVRGEMGGSSSTGARVWMSGTGGSEFATWGEQGNTVVVRSRAWTFPSLSPSTLTSVSAVVSASGFGTNRISFTIDGRSYTATGSDARTANRGGQMTLITPFRLWAGMPNGGVGGFATLALDFAPVPEPSTAFLLGSGLLGIAAFGRRQR